MKKFECGLTGYKGNIGKSLIKSKKIKFSYFRGDVRKIKDLINWINKNNFNYLVHLAAIVPIKEVNKNKKKAYQVNTLGTENLVKAILQTKNQIKWFFFASTSHVYASSKVKIKENSKIKPISYYGTTKYLAEKKLYKLRSKNIKVCIGRIFSTANSNQRRNYLVPDLKYKIKKFDFLNLENLNHYRDFISIKDISKIIIFFIRSKFSGIVNICSGKKIKLSKIANIIAAKYKKKIFIKANKKFTCLVGNNQLLKKIYQKKINISLKKIIFEN
jgi:nucleoside-diphosphate-sugar epimerase